MKSKLIVLTLTALMSVSILAGCAKKEVKQTPAPAQTKTDTVATASIVDNSGAFEKAIAKDGKWIIATTKDIKTDKNLVLEGEFKNGKKDESGKDVIQRKIALYTQDDKRNITGKFRLEAPKLTVKSPQASIQHGTFKGDIYVETKDFQLVDTKVEGNIYFANNDDKAGFKMDKDSQVTGKMDITK